MALDKIIKDFPKQLEFEPVVENIGNFKLADKFIVCGMGGSHLAADLIKAARPDLDIIIHSDYGLPETNDINEWMVIVSSYSGNTEEALDSFSLALEKKLDVAVISTGGKLIEQAEAHGVSLVRIPDTGIQPRSAVGFSVRALLKLFCDEDALAEIKKLSKILGDNSEGPGRELAEKLKGRVPIIYSSAKNQALAQNWKIRFNETAKIPAFYNVFPELNHNEMTGFDIIASTKKLSQNLAFIFLRDPDDHPRIIKRMDMTQKLLEDRGFEVNIILPIGQKMLSDDSTNVWHKIFSSILTADWTVYFLALYYGSDPEQVPMVEEFKKTMV